MKLKLKIGDRLFGVFAIVFIVAVTVFCLYPLLMMVAVSFSDEKMVQTYGFSIIPMKFSLETYKYVFSSSSHKILDAYKITVLITVLGTTAALVFSSMVAFVLSVRDFRHRNKLAFYFYFTMVFNPGILPWFIVCTKYLGFTNNLIALIVPYMCNVWYMFLLRNYFNGVPYELYESSRVDGAGYFKIYYAVAVPIARVGFITIGMFFALHYWNDWYLSLLFITKRSLYPLQFMTYSMLANIRFLTTSEFADMGGRVTVPMETAKMAVICITTGPIIFLYPFVQKYFVKGITIGAVKG